MPFRRSHRRGFTLTEVAIVLGIIGMILSGIWTAYAAVSHARQAADMTRELETTVENAQKFYYNKAASGVNDTTTSLAEAGVFPADLIPNPALQDADGELLTSQGYGFGSGVYSAGYSSSGTYSYTDDVTIGSTLNPYIFYMYIYDENDSETYTIGTTTYNYSYHTGSQPFSLDVCMRVVMDLSQRPDLYAIDGPTMTWYKLSTQTSFTESYNGTPYYTYNGTQSPTPGGMSLTDASTLCQDATYSYNSSTFSYSDNQFYLEADFILGAN